MDNQLFVNLDRNLFGGCAEHLGRWSHGGIHDPDSPLSNPNRPRPNVPIVLHHFNGDVTTPVVNGPDIKAMNGFGRADQVFTRQPTLAAKGRALPLASEPHSLTVLVCPVS